MTTMKSFNLGKKIGCYNFPKGRKTLAIHLFENGFVLRKEKNEIILDKFSLMILEDIIYKFKIKSKILENLND